jgi:hypothetical protein
MAPDLRLVNHCPLAINQQGEPFDVPNEARGWRVRRQSQGGRGTPMLVRIEGKPLRLELDATYEDLLEAVDGVPGVYRLDPVDEYGNLVPGFTAVTEVANGLKYHDNVNPVPVLLATIEKMAQGTNEALRHIAAQQAQLVQQSAFLMEANVKLLGAGGGLPQRPGAVGETPAPQDKVNWPEVAKEGIAQLSPGGAGNARRRTSSSATAS